MKNYSFTYYHNNQKDAQGRHTAMWDGFKPGDPLVIAYRGLLQADQATSPPTEPFLGQWIAELLFMVFNSPSWRPPNYFGPSMSLGDVVEVQGQFFAVAAAGWVSVGITDSEISYCEGRWGPAWSPNFVIALQ